MKSAEKMSGRGKTIFITGTGTSVGKTFVAALLLDYFQQKMVRAGYQKWVSTGGGEDDALPEDLAYCLKVAGMEHDPTLLDAQVPYRFRFPASPHLAAEMEAREIDIQKIVERHREMEERYEILIVEGVGGLMVPLRRDLLLADLLAHLSLPTLIVASSGLGTLNHTLLTLEALRRRDIPILGIVFSDPEEPEDEVVAQDNMKTLAQVGQVRVFGRLPRCGSVDEARDVFSPVGGAILEAVSEIFMD